MRNLALLSVKRLDPGYFLEVFDGLVHEVADVVDLRQDLCV